MLVHYLQCGQKLEKHLIIKRKTSKTISQCHQFLSGDLYIYQVDYHKRAAQKQPGFSVRESIQSYIQSSSQISHQYTLSSESPSYFQQYNR